MNALLPVTDTLSAPVDPDAAVHAAALALRPHLERGQCVDATILRGAVETAAAFG